MANQKEKKQGTFAKLIEVYKFTSEYKPHLIFWIIGGLLLPTIIGLVIFLFTGIWFAIIFGFLIGIILAMLALSRNADTAGFKSIEGKQGASGAILNSIKSMGWKFYEEPLWADPKTMNLIFWGVGRAGAVIVSEGPINQLNKAMSSQEAKIKRVVPNLQVYKIYSGDGKGQTPIKQLRKKIMKFKPVLTKDELSAVQKRLASINKFQAPIPKGMDPNRIRASHR